MRNYDVVVIGAGPAGGQCARQLALRGFEVLIVDRLGAFTDRNFSSAGSLKDIVNNFSLPDSIVNSTWNSFKIVSTNESVTKKSEDTLGVVLEFSKLREFLSSEAQSLGADLKLSHAYVSHEYEHNSLKVKIRDLRSNELFEVKTSYLVDASGSSRAILGDNKLNSLWGFGQEWVVKSDVLLNPHELVFFLGKVWAEKGYAWIFPNGPSNWKVGYGTFSLNKKETHSLTPGILKVLDKYFVSSNHYSVLEKHGGFIRHSVGLKDRYFDEGRRVIAVGDNISLCNPLGGEGIRHALWGATLCARALETSMRSQHVGTQKAAFDMYRKAIRKGIYWKWIMSEKYAIRSYISKSDADWDKSLRRMKKLEVDEIVQILFDYKFTVAPRIILKTISQSIFGP